MEINYEAQIEAILFTMGESVEITKIAKALELKPGEVKKIVKSMQEKMNDSSRGIKIIELDGAYQMCTKPEMYEALIRVAKQPRKQVLTDVLMETLLNTNWFRKWEEWIHREDPYCSVQQRNS